MGDATTPPAAPAPATTAGPPPTFRAAAASFVLIAVAVIVAAVTEPGEPFAPRVGTIDGLAGLVIGAFAVDRLLTFVPPMFAAVEPARRETDLRMLRLGFGAILGLAFVLFTDLQAVAALVPEGPGLPVGTDRALAVLAIAGGVAGLSAFVDALNPPPETDGKTDDDRVADTGVVGKASARVRWLALALVLVAVGVAWLIDGPRDESGLDLIGPGEQEDETTAIVLRFGIVLLAAAIVEQLLEQVGRVGNWSTNNRAVFLGGVAVIFGVLAAWAFDLYLLHNVGFFGTAENLNASLAASSGDRVADTFLTGLVIAAGAKPLHDLDARLRKAKTEGQAANAAG